MITSFRISASALLGAISGKLYRDPGACLQELVRNAAGACMEPGTWKPEKVQIEIRLEPHPVGRGKSLVVLDHGRGLTQWDLTRYFEYLGPPASDIQAALSGNGAAQNGLGRFAALALVSGCIEGDITERIKHGYCIFSRTASKGQVRMVSVIPEQVEANKGFDIGCFVEGDDRELGSMRYMSGPFTAIVIPDPVFGDEAEIREALKWHLPRDQSKTYGSLTVGGKTLTPPPLANVVNITSNGDKDYHAHMAAGNVESGGLWLCDTLTGLRVARFMDLAPHVPQILCAPELVGDVFVPGVLAKQDTARSTLAPGFMSRNSKAWMRIMSFLALQVAPAAESLVEADPISGQAADTLGEIVDMIKSNFPEPEPEKKPAKPRDPPGPVQPTEPVNPDPDDKDKPKRRYIRLFIGGEWFTLYRALTMDPYILVQAATSVRNLMVNVGQYAAFPSNGAARREHFLMSIMRAVAESRFPTDPHMAQQAMNQLCEQARRKKGGK
jgi:hypothetical protein